MNSWARTLMILGTLVLLSFINASEEETICPRKVSLWDKWYNGCNWCVCTEDGPVCTQKACSRSEIDRCENLEEKWRDGCYRCQCQESGIVCVADHRCVHALKHEPLPCAANEGCVCGLDGVPSCPADDIRADDIKANIHGAKGRHGKKNMNTVDISDIKGFSRPQEPRCTGVRRWYDGSRRCFCLGKGGVAKCGNPRQVAQRIDGFRLKVILCPSQLVWHHHCRRCRCHMSGVAFCTRIPNCKRESDSEKDKILTPSAECQMGSQWNEGCKQCECNEFGKIVCDNSDCNESGQGRGAKVKTDSPSISLGSDGVKLHTDLGKGDNDKELPGPVEETKIQHSKTRVPFKLPTPIMDMDRRFRPFQTKPKPVLCAGKFKPGDRYYVKCNLCLCTATGDPLCTAVWCD